MSSRDIMEDQAQEIFDTARESLLVLDSLLRVRVANQAFYQTFQASPAETLGRHLFDLGDGQWNVPRLRMAITSIIPRDAQVRDFEVNSEFGKIGAKCMLLNARRIGKAGVSSASIFVAIEDVTEKRLIQKALRQLNLDLDRRVRERTAQLENTNKELEAFCYSVSHDLRAPLRGIDGFSQELAVSHASQLDELAQHYLARIRTGVQRMSQLIDDLLQLSKITREEMRRDHVNLIELIDSIVDDLRRLEPDRQVTFLVEPGMTAQGDRRLLRLVLENLLANAWKFTSRRPQATIEIGRAMRKHAQIVFFVRDDGVGFDMAFAAKLFGAFQRLHGEREFPGNGIGLATAQRIVHRHGGKIWAESAINHGATFYFTLN
jgi:signal transduction histidine kinase